MGYGSYSQEAHEQITHRQASVPVREVFKSTKVISSMSPYQMKVRESRDSADHPNSIAIAFGLDLTGSMSGIPKNLARRYLPNFMQVLLGLGVVDPQVLFAGIGDVATDDRNAFQMGQFESTAELMNKWLTEMALELCDGGGNGGESYHLFAAALDAKTVTDCFTVRGQKGIAFITGDDRLFAESGNRDMSTVFGDIAEARDGVEAIFRRAMRTWDIFCIIPDAHRAMQCKASWSKVLGTMVIVAHSEEDICDIAGSLAALQTGAVTSLRQLQSGLKGLGRSDANTARIIAAVEDYAHSISRGAPERPAEPVKAEAGTPRQRRQRRDGSV